VRRLLVHEAGAALMKQRRERQEVWERRCEMRKIIESKKATVVTHVLTGAGGLTVLVAVLAAGLKWS
jgi:hypothetical protein